MRTRGWPDGDNVTLKGAVRIPRKGRQITGECEVCHDHGKMTRHHIVPREIRPTTETVLVCERCHKLIHADFTNHQLAQIPWEEIRLFIQVDHPETW